MVHQLRNLVHWLALAMAGYALSFGTAQAGPLCSGINVTLANFASCVVENSNDDLPSVQAGLNVAIIDAPLLDGIGSFSPGPQSDGTEFTGDSIAVGFNITPDSVSGSNTFTFLSLPPDTLFVSIKQANDFEVFKVTGLPFGPVTHQLEGVSTSHISTFVANVEVPEPATIMLLGLGLAGLGFARKRQH